MKRKIWKWIFSIFIASALVGLATFLVLHDNNDTDADVPENPDETEEIFATAYSFNIPETIYIAINTEANLLTGYINTTPAHAISKLTYEVAPKDSGVAGGVEFNGNKIVAKTLGNYIIRFKIPKSTTSNFTKNLNVVVHDNTNLSHICQTSESIIIGERKNINELFSIKELTEYTIQTDSKTSYSNSYINAISNGKSEIKFTFKDNYINYIYKFTIDVEELPEFEIILKNTTNNTIEIDFDVETNKHIEFRVQNREQGYVQQTVDAVSSNENIVRVVSYTEPFIKIEAVGLGEAIIRITYSLDKTIYVELKVIVI